MTCIHYNCSARWTRSLTAGGTPLLSSEDNRK
eukprot:CAMPEP_0117514640 /NCGR_PEP_ID=MMETSP0784-20121206/30172_1 /TAXON_ID=39447 /ORGANISM="" /LENGTH=31 /DNA_ID= /DNA_START= /DNA_END= /DNA_ORIENTATION=